MAMVGVTKRSIEEFIPNSKDLKDVTGVGPGTYSPKLYEKDMSYTHQKAPPFNTQDGKWSPEKESVKKNIPGPGAYNLSQDLNKGKVIALNMDKRTYYIQDPANAHKRMTSLDNSIKKDRLDIVSKDQNPGPGAYEADSLFDKMIEAERVRK